MCLHLLEQVVCEQEKYGREAMANSCTRSKFDSVVQMSWSNMRIRKFASGALWGCVG